jgi:hypothetical protein
MAKKAKRTDKSPARSRYWTSGNLAFRKIRNMVLSGMSVDDALEVWEKSRRRKKGDVPYRRIEALRQLERH